MSKDIQDEESISMRSSMVPHLGLIALLTATLFFILTSQNPESGPFVVILALCLVFLICLTVSVIALKIANKLFTGRSLTGVRILYTSIAVSIGIVYLIGMNTLHQLQPIDVILVLAFEVLLNFYLLRRF